ncbi:flagellar biosynthesis anti-sigma factor FlgM [Kerstersia gyiorum]|uniref:flagellar biosynthesis anti-sigma factor FlgM n=1 Tax=Kerstersia gyiorum TaxID=206506 RepID=UPI0039EAB4DB
MIIPTNPLSNAPASAADSARERAPATSGRQEKTGAASAAVSISPSAASLSAASLSAASLDAARAPAEPPAAATGDVDTAKVGRIILALRQGEYRMDTARIADGLLASAKDLLKP